MNADHLKLKKKQQETEKHPWPINLPKIFLLAYFLSFSVSRTTCLCHWQLAIPPSFATRGQKTNTIPLADFGRCKPVNACQPYSPHYNMQISRLYCSRSNMQCTALVTLPMETGVAIGVYNVLDIFTDNEEYEILSATPQYRAELYCLFLSLFARRERPKNHKLCWVCDNEIPQCSSLCWRF